MNVWEPSLAARALDLEDASLEAAPILPAPFDLSPFEITRPASRAPTGPLVFASPHSGRIYPPCVMEASRLDAASIRRSEDVWVDGLIAAAPDYGAPVIAARLARVYIDVNREAWELDPAMFSDELPAYARGRTARVAAGLGAIARIVTEGQEIYHRKLTFAEARARVEAAHRPYHQALRGLVDEAVAREGQAILIDWHSMPSAAAQQAGGGACDIVLGDRFGGACAPALSRLVEHELTAMGYVVTRNAPYAGGYTTEHYGRPARRVHALQIELNRALYLDEASLDLTLGFDSVKRDLERLFGVLAAADFSRL